MAEDEGSGATSLWFQTLGPLQVQQEQRQLPLGAPLERAMLAALVVDAPNPVSVPELIDRLWTGEPPDTAVKSIQKYISTLRRILGPERIESVGGYRLSLEHAQIDAIVFERVLLDGESADTSRRLADLEMALGLWRGDPYADLPEPLFLEPVRARLREVRLALIEERLDLLADLGRLEQVASETGELVETHPLRERLWQLRMSALAGLDRPAEALGEFQRLRRHLGDRLGLEPSPATTALEERIILQDPALGLAPKSSGNLPAARSSILGRHDDLVRIDELLRRSRLVTVVGTGGVGKTTIALEAARRAAARHTGGAWFVGLGPLADPARVPGRTAELLGVGELSDLDPAEALVDFLSRRNALVILDNCEHLIDAVAGMVERVLQFGPGVTVLATSRQPLRLAGETVFSLDTLSYPPPGERSLASVEYPAVGLLVARAEEAGARLGPIEKALPDLAEVARRLDGIPLALELAAARLRVLSAEELVDRLRERLPDFGSGRRDAPDRQRTLEAAIDWSFQLLDAEEKMVLAGLSVFRGGFTLDAAEAVCGEPGVDVLRVLSSLLEKSLVSVAPWTDGATRYFLLHVIRLFAEEKLGDRRGEIERRHASHFSSLAGGEHASERFDPASLQILNHDIENMRAALGHLLDSGEVVAGLRLATSLGYHWFDKGALVEAQTWLTRSLDMAPDAPTELRAEALLTLSNAFQPSSSELSLKAAESALAAARTTQDRRLIAEALCDVGRLHAVRIEREPALPLINEALTMFEQLDDKVGMAKCHEAIAVAHRGRTEDSEHYQVAVGLLREAGAEYELASTLFSMSYRSLIPNGRYDEARRALEESQGFFERLGLRHGMLHVATALAQLARLDGDLEGARALIGDTLEGARDAGDRRCTVRMLTALARVLLAQGDSVRALALLEEALAVSAELDRGLSSDVHELIDSLALVAQRAGERELAGVWFGAAESIRLRQGLLRAPPDQATVDGALGELGREVGAERLSTLLDQGSQLSLDEIAAELSQHVLVRRSASPGSTVHS